MAVSKKTEKFSQIGYLQVVESAANTLTFAGMSVFSNVLSNQGMIIHSAEYNLSGATLALPVASGDSVAFGLSGSDSLTSIDLDDPEVYDFNKYIRVDYGTAATGVPFMQPYKFDFTGLPGGGMLVPADRLFAYVQGASVAAAATVSVRFRYTLITLGAQDYLELAQTLRVLK